MVFAAASCSARRASKRDIHIWAAHVEKVTTRGCALIRNLHDPDAPVVNVSINPVPRRLVRSLFGYSCVSVCASELSPPPPPSNPRN